MPVMPRRGPVYGPEKIAAFENWAETTASDAAILCRLYHHDLPTLLDADASIEHQRDGTWYQEDECRRRCGVKVLRWIGQDGIVSRTKVVPMKYDYTDASGYLIPADARMRMGRAQFGFLRTVALKRREEQRPRMHTPIASTEVPFQEPVRTAPKRSRKPRTTEAGGGQL